MTQIVDRAEPGTYAAMVGKALVADRFRLDEFPVLSELPAIEAWAASHPRALLARGSALQAILRKSVADVAAAYAEDDDASLRRLAAFVRMRYLERRSVAAIADEWRMNRSALSHCLSRKALLLISHRFLQLVQQMCWETNEAIPAAKAS